MSDLDIPLDRDGFIRSLMFELAGALEDVVGVEEAAGYFSLVGQRVGDQLNLEYKVATGADRLDRGQVARMLVDVKRRIKGDFFIVEETDDRIILGNRRCPFAEKVLGRDSMCMITSNMFGAITADHLGFAKVELRETIARGAAGCQVAIYLRPTAAAEAAAGREYYGDRGQMADAP